MFNQEWVDPYLPKTEAEYNWASTIDQYRLCDVCWSIPYWPDLTPIGAALSQVNWRSVWPPLWIVERFNPDQSAWASQFVPALKDWAFSKDSFFWRLLGEKQRVENFGTPNAGYARDIILEQISQSSSLSLNLAGEGTVNISFLVQYTHPASTRIPGSDYLYFLKDADIVHGSVVVRPGLDANWQEEGRSGLGIEARYSGWSYWGPPLLYVQRRNLLVRISGEKAIQIDGRIKEGKILFGSVVVSATDLSLVQQAEAQLDYYSYSRVTDIITLIDDYVNPAYYDSLLNQCDLKRTPLGHIYFETDLGPSQQFETGSFQYRLVTQTNASPKDQAVLLSACVYGYPYITDYSRIFYPATNNIWNNEEIELSIDSSPLHVEFYQEVSLNPVVQTIRQGEEAFKFWIDQDNIVLVINGIPSIEYTYQTDNLEYIPGLGWEPIWESFNPLSFSAANIQAWMATQWAKTLEFYEEFGAILAQADSNDPPPWQIVDEWIKRYLQVGNVEGPRTIEMHWALGAEKFAYKDENSTQPDRVATLGYYIERIARVLGISVNPDGSIRPIRQKAIIKKGNPIPAGWNFGQWGENEGNDTPSSVVENQPQQGGGVGTIRDGIVYENRCNQFIEDPFTGVPTAIVEGDYVLCENWPQYIDQMLDDLDHAIDWQELGAFAIPGADNTDKTLFAEGLAQMVGELLYMSSAISRNTSQTHVATLITQGIASEIIKAFGQPIIPKAIRVDIGEEQPASLPYPGLRVDAVTVTQMIGWLLQNLAYLNSAVSGPPPPDNEDPNPNANQGG